MKMKNLNKSKNEKINFSLATCCPPFWFRFASRPFGRYGLQNAKASGQPRYFAILFNF